MPKSKGPNSVENSAGLGTNEAFLPVNDGFQHKTYPNIFGVGAVADLPVSFKTLVPVRIPRTGLSRIMRKDIVETYTKLMAEILAIAKDGADLLIQYGWLEKIPETVTRETLTH
ncbi:MAG: DUF3231 family protein [Desulfosporosinus sp.]|nr:DUF3231 family protein [Desulfosporosinus sp.]